MTSRTPCLAGLRPLSCSCSLTIWVASENRLAKLRTPRTYCFNAGFSVLPNGVTPQPGSAASDTVHNTGANNRSGRIGRTCDADTRSGVSLIRQLGNDGCEQGSSWGYTDRGIWVDRGCRGEFGLYYRATGDNWDND